MKPPSLHVTFPVSDLVAPGVRGTLQVHGWGPELNTPVEQRNGDRSERGFTVVGHLGKFSNVGVLGLRADLTDEDGASFLRLPVHTGGLDVTISNGMLAIATNSDHEVSAIHFQCTASSSIEARKRFFEASLPILDKMSYELSVPIFLNSVRIEDVRNAVTVIEYVSPYAPIDFPLGSMTVEPEIKAIYAMHREAMNSASDFYRFFCYYKILEGLTGAVRAELFLRARQKSIQLTRRRLLVPETKIPNGPYEVHTGSPLNAFFNSVLTPVMRNALAHFMLDDGGVLNLSSAEHIDGYSAAIPVVKACARIATEDYQTLLREFHAYDA